VTKVYGTGSAAMQALRGVDLCIAAGEFLAVMGPSGSGKSTSMNILGCLDAPTDGAYRFMGVDVGALTRDQRALLRRNKMRSFLTMLGIIIGVAAVITLVTLGGGATQQVTQQISSLGSNMLMIRPGKHMGPGQSSGAGPFKLADAEALARDIPSLAAVAPNVGSSMVAIYAHENWNTTVTGTSEQYFIISNRKVGSGRIFTPGEVRSGAAVCVIGETVRKKLFGSLDPIGSRIRLTKLSCEVIGVMAPKGQSSMGTDQDDLVVIPLRTYQRRVAGNTDVNMIQVSVRDGSSTEKAEADIRRLLRVRRHRHRPRARGLRRVVEGPDGPLRFQRLDHGGVVSLLSGRWRGVRLFSCQKGRAPGPHRSVAPRVIFRKRKPPQGNNPAAASIA